MKKTFTDTLCRQKANRILCQKTFIKILFFVNQVHNIKEGSNPVNKKKLYYGTNVYRSINERVKKGIKFGNHQSTIL